MKTTVLFFLVLLIANIAVAQRPAADKIETSKGPLSIQPLNHATLALTWQGKTIYTDPNGGATGEADKLATTMNVRLYKWGAFYGALNKRRR